MIRVDLGEIPYIYTFFNTFFFGRNHSAFKWIWVLLPSYYLYLNHVWQRGGRLRLVCKVRKECSIAIIEWQIGQQLSQSELSLKALGISTTQSLSPFSQVSKHFFIETNLVGLEIKLCIPGVLNMSLCVRDQMRLSETCKGDGFRK